MAAARADAAEPVVVAAARVAADAVGQVVEVAEAPEPLRADPPRLQPPRPETCSFPQKTN